MIGAACAAMSLAVTPAAAIGPQDTIREMPCNADGYLRLAGDNLLGDHCYAYAGTLDTTYPAHALRRANHWYSGNNAGHFAFSSPNCSGCYIYFPKFSNGQVDPSDYYALGTITSITID
ncbi:hypothetical protein GCM10009765_21350 [Fodinicola feengrottensis]|uniref:Uncharacterized protein n=2 Tax=Fodinicola feengrottensis TaxID=435914 RepID=A0ABP4SH55_9ACTN